MKNSSERVVRDKRQLVIPPRYLSYLVFICGKLFVLLEFFAWSLDGRRNTAVFVRDCQRAEMDGILVNMLEQGSTVCSFC